MSRLFCILFAGALFPACAEPESTDPSPIDEADLDAEARIIEDGTPEAAGVLDFVNSGRTTFVTLDEEVGLDARAARNVIAHRDGKDQTFGTADDDLFDSIDELDGIAYVGDAALAALLQSARELGWISSDEGVYGMVEGVELTRAEAAAMVAIANTATLTRLDDEIGLDARAAKGIVDNRPYPSVEGVAAVPYVGKNALTRLRDFAAENPVEMLSGAPAEAQLAALVPDLWHMSESDYPLTVFRVKGGGRSPITTANAKSALKGVIADRADEVPFADRYVELADLARFFDRYTVPQDYWEDVQRDQLPAWRGLRDTFELQLKDAKVFRFGELRGTSLSGSIDIVVVGTSADGDLVGFFTIGVET
jgi:hypothetical protein